MSEKQAKVKILDMTYEEDHIFIVEILDLEKDQKAKLAIRAEDFGIPKQIKMLDGSMQDIPLEVVNKFCKDMIGREKNITVQQDNYKGYDKNPSKAQIDSLHEYMDTFPYKELLKQRLNED